MNIIKNAVKHKEHIADIYIISTSTLLTLVGIYSAVGNLIIANDIDDIFTSILSTIAVGFTIYAHFLFYFKKDSNYRLFISIPYLYYFLLMFTLSSYKKPPVIIGFVFSALYLVITSLDKKKKALIFLSVILGHALIANLQLNNILPIIHEEQQYITRFVEILTIDILLVGLIVFLIYFRDIIVSSKKATYTTEFIFSYNKNLPVDNTTLNEKTDSKADSVFMKKCAEHELTRREESVINLLRNNPGMTYLEIAVELNIAKSTVGSTMQRIYDKVRSINLDDKEYEMNKYNLIKYFTGKLD